MTTDRSQVFTSYNESPRASIILEKRRSSSSAVLVALRKNKDDDDINTSIASIISTLSSYSSPDSSPERRVSDPGSPEELVPDSSNNDLSDVSKSGSSVFDFSAKEEEEEKEKTPHLEEPRGVENISSFDSYDSQQQRHKDKMTISDSNDAPPRANLWDACTSREHFEKYMEYYEEKERRVQDYERSMSGNYQPYDAPPGSLWDACASKEHFERYMEYYKEKERRNQDHKRSRSGNYQLYDVPPPVSLWDACCAREGAEKYEEYINNGGLARHLAYQEEKAQESKQCFSGDDHQSKNSFSLKQSSGFAGFYIVAPVEYDLRLMSELPNNNNDQAETGKIYLSREGAYVVRDLEGIVRNGKIDLAGLSSYGALKKRILEATADHTSFGKQQFFANSEYDDSVEDRNTEIFRNNSDFFKEKCVQGQFIYGSESDESNISMLRISPEATQRGGMIAGIAKYRRIEKKEEKTCFPIVQHAGKNYEMLSWQPIKKVRPGYLLLGRLVNFADSYGTLPLLKPSISPKDEKRSPTLIDQFIYKHESKYKSSCFNVTNLTKSVSYSELNGEGIIKHARRSTFFGMTFENRTFTILRDMEIIDENGNATRDKGKQFKAAINSRKNNTT